MTESKKKTAKKEVEDTSKAAEMQEMTTETTVVAEAGAADAPAEVTAVEEEETVAAAATATAEDYGMGSDVKKEKRAKKAQAGEEAAEAGGNEMAAGAPKHAPSAEEFDWDAFESEELRSSPKYREYESMYDETLSTVAVDEVVLGTVIQMTSREVVINIGYKSEGVVSLNEFRYNPGLKVGDKVEVYVESQEDKKGQLLLSHKK
ncbi:MAG: S1 RNA-binding domain-containing protein, partial [Bacteroidales bacterium]|nr:S1 RNA-binding domain-containing protein [Bacteroidales bacterium]